MNSLCKSNVYIVSFKNRINTLVINSEWNMEAFSIFFLSISGAVHLFTHVLNIRHELNKMDAINYSQKRKTHINGIGNDQRANNPAMDTI